MLPIRFIGEALGVKVDYNEHTSGITMSRLGLLIKLSIESYDMQVNEENIPLDVAPEIRNSRTFVPIRAVAEAFGCDVQYFENERKVEIKTDEKIIEMWLDRNEARLTVRK